MQERGRRHRAPQLVTSVTTLIDGANTGHQLPRTGRLQTACSRSCESSATRQGFGCKHSPGAGDFYQQKHGFSTAEVPAPKPPPLPASSPSPSEDEVGSAASAPAAEAGALLSFAQQDKNASKAALRKRFLFAKATS